MDTKLEIVVLPVADVDRAKNFYKTLGWREDADLATSEDFRVVQPHRDERTDGWPCPGPGQLRLVVSFSDPDGNGWLLQEVTTRLPGRIDRATTSYSSSSDLSSALRRAKDAHGEHEKRTGVPDENWLDWYADYMVAEQAGTELPK